MLLTTAVVAIGMLVAVLAGGASPVAAQTPSADCAGSGGGAKFLADGGFEVEYNDTQPMPDDGVFVNDSAMQFRNVTLIANGSASLRLENGTGPTTCYADVNATETPITIDPDDGGWSAVVNGSVAALSLGNATVDDGSAAFAYNASSGWKLTIYLGGGTGTAVEARDADSGATLAQGTVDGNGSLTLSLPAGPHAVSLVTPTGSGGGGGSTSSTESPTPTPTSTPPESTVTPTPTPIVTDTPTRMPTTTGEPESTATVTEERTSRTSSPTTTIDQGRRVFGFAVVLGVLIAGALLAERRLR